MAATENVPWVCLDNGIFTLLTDEKEKRNIKGERYEKRKQVVEVFNNILIENGAKNWSHVVSPFLAYEATGTVFSGEIEKYTPQIVSFSEPWSESSSEKISEEFQSHLTEISEKMHNDGFPNWETLKKNSEDRKKYLTDIPIAKKLWEDLVEVPLSSDKFIDDLRNAFACDRLQEGYRREYLNLVKCAGKKELISKEENTKYFLLFVDLTRIYFQGAPLSTLRAAETLARARYCYDLRNGESKKTTKLLEAVKQAKLKENRDFLDTEYIQYACVGNWLGEGQNLEPVISFTLDPWEKVLARCQLLDGAFYLDALKENIFNERALGKIVVLNPESGKLETTILPEKW